MTRRWLSENAFILAGFKSIDGSFLLLGATTVSSFARLHRFGLPRLIGTDWLKELEARLGAQLLQRIARHVSSALDGATEGPAYKEPFGQQPKRIGSNILVSYD